MNTQEFSPNKKIILIVSWIVFLSIGFAGGYVYEHSVLIPHGKELSPLTIMQYYSTPELLIKAIKDKQISCENLPLDIQRIVNTINEGLCNTKVTEGSS